MRMSISTPSGRSLRAASMTWLPSRASPTTSSMYPLALLSAAGTIIVLRTRVLPRWLGYGAAVTAAALAINAGFLHATIVPGLPAVRGLDAGRQRGPARQAQKQRRAHHPQPRTSGPLTLSFLLVCVFPAACNGRLGNALSAGNDLETLQDLVTRREPAQNTPIWNMTATEPQMAKGTQNG